jgi:hypothetical protein
VAAYCADTTDVLGLILEKEKVVINRRDNNGHETALHYAVRGKRVDNVGYTCWETEPTAPYATRMASLRTKWLTRQSIKTRKFSTYFCQMKTKLRLTKRTTTRITSSYELQLRKTWSMSTSWTTVEHSNKISNPLKGAMDQLELIGNTSSGVQSTSD